MSWKENPTYLTNSSFYPYHNGQSEVVVGKALKNGYREKVKLATKLPSWLIKNRDDMDRVIKVIMLNILKIY